MTNSFLKALTKNSILEYKRLSNGVALVTLSSEQFNLEHKRRSIPNLVALWGVSILAMLTNLGKALAIKLSRQNGDTFAKILWEMGRDPNHTSSYFFDRFSCYAHQAKMGAAGWQSLDLFYNYHEKIKPVLNHDIEGKLTRYWMMIENRQVVTNRLKIAINVLVNAFSRFAKEPEIRIVSIACGSAQAVIAAILQCSNLRIKAVLLDCDETAIKEAQRRVREAGLENRFVFFRGTTSKIEEICADFRPHIIEMMGFLDYRPKDKAIRLINRIKCCLPPNGLFITCNINRNIERIFLDWVLLWPMIYRDEKELSEVILAAGFSPENVALIYEPRKIHGIAVCQNDSDGLLPVPMDACILYS